MQFVDYDPSAARAAAEACRDAAEDLRETAGVIDGLGGHLAAWAGATRIEFDEAAADIARDLRSEADDLESTAEAIDAATERAWSAESTRRTEYEANLPEGVR